MAQNKDIQQIIQSIGEQYAPDKRVEVFDIKATNRGDTLVLRGETTSESARDELLAQVKTVTTHVKDSIRLLPDKKLGEETWGVVYNSAGIIRYAPTYSAEMVSQALMGMPVRILDKKGGWRRVQTPDKYIGWISGSVQPMTKSSLQQYVNQPKIVVTSMYAQSFERADAKSQPVSDLVAGDMIALKDTKGKFYHVVYADGREAYVQKPDAANVNDWLKNIELSGESIVKTAKRFMGVPYVWGGTCTKGVDCSGFTKSVYFLHGIILARDASQQALYGKLIDEKGDFDTLQPGDLVFFGRKADDENPKERVVHVGIALGNKKFIHASDYIRIASFDPDDPFYDEYNTNRYLRTKRIIGEVNTKGIDEIFKNEFYK